jgi:TPP-dependent pyruvate/acetoin dehydrogenase alpha subunit
MALTEELAKKIYSDMWRIRMFEEEANRQLGLGNVVGALHLYCGEEAVAVGVCSNLRDDDYIVGTHRSHGHCLAKGADMDHTMAELFGKADGTCSGKGGSMHVADLTLNILGANGIVAGGLGPGTGTALASKIRKTDQVSICFFGDGAAARGPVHEAMTMGSLWKLPVVYVCENNGLQQWVRRETVAVIDSVATMAGSYGIPGVSVDGQNVVEVYEAVGEAVDRARRGEGPTLIEARTYRFYGHSPGDLEVYRDSEEVEDWRANQDPITIFRAYMAERQWLTEREDEEIQGATAAAVSTAVKFADASAYPAVEEALTDVLDTSWRAEA